MKEKIKVTGQGELHDKEYGKILMNPYEPVVVIDKETPVEQSIIYDSKVDQYCVDGQWEIPFHQNQFDNILSIENKLKKFFFDIKEIKNEFVKKQMYEVASATRDIEKSILFITEELKKRKNKLC